MNDFLKGMSTIGQLNPAPASFTDYPNNGSAWKGVSDSFKQVGDNLRKAIKECTDAKRESKQT